MDFGFAVVNIFDSQIELILVMLDRAVLFGSAIRQHSQQTDRMFFIPRQDTVVEQVYSGNGMFQFCKADLGVSVNEGLLVNTPDSLDGAHINGWG